MAAAARTARQEMMQRIREKRTTEKSGQTTPTAKTQTSATGRQPPEDGQPTDGDGNPLSRMDRPPRNRQRRNRFRSGGGGQLAPKANTETAGRFPSDGQRSNGDANPARRQGNRPAAGRPRHADEDAQPRSHESTLFKTHRDEFKPVRNKSNSGQPDPLRTSVDSIRRRNSAGGSGKQRRGPGSWKG